MASPRKLSDSSSIESPESTHKDAAVISSSADKDLMCTAEMWLLTMFLDIDHNSYLLLEGISPTNNQPVRIEYSILFNEQKSRFSVQCHNLETTRDLEQCYYHATRIDFQTAMEFIGKIERERDAGFMKLGVEGGEYSLRALKTKHLDLSFFSIKDNKEVYNKDKTRFNWCLARLNTLVDEPLSLAAIEQFKIQAKFVESEPKAQDYGAT